MGWRGFNLGPFLTPPCPGYLTVGEELLCQHVVSMRAWIDGGVWQVVI